MSEYRKDRALVIYKQYPIALTTEDNLKRLKIYESIVIADLASIGTFLAAVGTASTYGVATGGWAVAAGAISLAMTAYAFYNIGVMLFGPKPNFGMDDAGGMMTGSPRYRFGDLQNTWSGEIPVPVVYGMMKVAGNIVWQDKFGETIIKQCIVVSEGEVEEILDVRINDITVADLNIIDNTVTLIELSKPYQTNNYRDIPIPHKLDPEWPTDQGPTGAADGWHGFYLQGPNGHVINRDKYGVDKSNNKVFFRNLSDLNDAQNELVFQGGQVSHRDEYFSATYKTNPILPNCSFDAYKGTNTQTVDSRLTGRVYGLRNTAYIAVTLEASPKLKGYTTVTSLIKGVKIQTYDGTQWTSAKTWSNNPAAIIRDYLTSTRYGVGLSEANIDDDSFAEVYDYCNGIVYSDQRVANLGSQKRFELDMCIDSSRSHIDIINDMLATFGGILTFDGFKLKLKVEKSEAATQSFDMDNIVENSFSYEYLSRDQMANKLRVAYIDKDKKYKMCYAVAEDKIKQDEAANIEGGNGVIQRDISLLGITRHSQALRMSHQYLNMIKFSSLLISFGAGIEALQCEAGDVIEVSHDVPNWTKKTFRIMAIKELPNDEVQILAKEHNGSIYSDNYPANIIVYDYGSPDNPYDALPEVTNLAIVESGYIWTDGTWINNIDATWTATTQPRRLLHQVIEQSIDGGAYTEVVKIDAAATSYRLVGVQTEATYTLRVRVVSDKNVMSDGATSNTITILGKQLPPGDVTNFTVAYAGDHLSFQWTAVSNIDLDGYEIREGTSWATSSLVAEVLAIANTYNLINFTAGVKTFRIKAKNRSGIYSLNDAADSINVTQKVDTNLVATHKMWADFDKLTIGTNLTWCYANSYDSRYNRKEIIFNTTNKWDDGVLKWDDTSINWDYPVTTSAGSYISDKIDLGATIASSINVELYNRMTENITQLVEIRTSTDDITWTAWVAFVPGTFTARYHQIRVTLQTSDEDYRVQAYDGIVTLDVPDLIQEDKDVSIADGGTAITFPIAYTSLKSLVVTTVGASALVPYITAQNVTGFTCKLEDTAGASQAGAINWFAKGY